MIIDEKEHLKKTNYNEEKKHELAKELFDDLCDQIANFTEKHENLNNLFITDIILNACINFQKAILTHICDSLENNFVKKFFLSYYISLVNKSLNNINLDESTTKDDNP